MSKVSSSSSDLTINADASTSDIKFTIDDVEKASISSAGAFTSTTIDATKLTGALPAISGASLTNLPAGGITESDHWRLTADITSDTDITTNLERVDDSSFSVLGTGMTHSSGIFTFPSTGYWFIAHRFKAHVGANDNMTLTSYYSTDSGSNWAQLANAGNSNQGTSAGQLRDTTSTVNGIFDVTSTSTHKIKFTTGSIGTNTVIKGNTSETQTSFIFIKLGDT